MRGGPLTSAFAAAKFGVRALSQSLAREFGPQGVHVAHFVLDGIFDTERVRGFIGSDFEEDTRMKPECVRPVCRTTTR